MVFFAASLPVAVATVSGDIDLGSAGLTAALYQLGGQGQVRIIAANARDAAGFPLYAFVASNKAYEAGLKSYKDVAGKSVALGEVGAPGALHAVADHRQARRRSEDRARAADAGDRQRDLGRHRRAGRCRA